MSASNYSVTHLKGLPVIGQVWPMFRDPLQFSLNISRQYGDIIIFSVFGQKVVQINHPDLIRYVLVDNYKNYKKNVSYIRFESVGGLGLLTSHGEKWKRDRKRIQPMFNREQIATYHYDIANEVTEKYKKKWLNSTAAGHFEINITREMAAITTEIIMKSVFGRDISDETVRTLHGAYDAIIDYLKNVRLFPRIDLRKCFHLPSYVRFKKALDQVDAIIHDLSQQYRQKNTMDRGSMFALLLDAQKTAPDYFNDQEIRDQCVTMIFAGFETTSILMQWMWYALNDRPDIRDALRKDIITAAPCAAKTDSLSLTFEALWQMNYLTAFFRETMRLYPSFWATGREPIEDDYWGDFKIEKGTTIALPQFAMHRHPKWWDNPEEFIVERFLSSNEEKYAEGIYFPFSHGPRKCSGFLFAEMEAKLVMAKLLPLFDVVALNKDGNKLSPSISLKLEKPLYVRISRNRAYLAEK